MDLTDVTASVVLSQQYSMPGHSDIYIMAERDREGVLSEEAVPTIIRTVAKTVKLKQKYLFQRRIYRTTTNLKKNIMDRTRGVHSRKV